jgi:hypothetical protein
MRHELNLVQAGITQDPKAPTTAFRRALREGTDALIHDGPIDLVEVVARSCQVMLTVACTMATYGHEPQAPDFYEAAAACIENGQAVMDKGLMLQSQETINCGAVMLEITVRGMCAALGVPYDQVLAHCYEAQQAGQSPDVRALLAAAGLVRGADPAANDSA